MKKLSKATEERLLLLMEECSEVSQAASKILRFGFENKHPEDLKGPTNAQNLYAEIGGLCAILELMDKSGEINLPLVELAEKDKLKSIHKFTKHQKG